MPLTRYKKFCYRVFGNLTEKTVSDKLKKDLILANMDIRASAYLAYAWMNTILTIIITSLILGILFLVVLPAINIHIINPHPKTLIEVLLFVLIFLVPFGMGFLVYFFHLSYPASRAKARGKKIDFTLPYALNYIAAMSAAGTPPHEIFISLSKQRIYGEVREEAARMAKDMKLLGIDVVTALKKAIERTPSERFREFLQGAVVTISSGGILKSYFMTKADQYMRDNRQKQKEYLETLSVMAESYVTAAVAGPLLILIILPLMMMIRGGREQLMFLYLFVCLILPLIHLAFAMVIRMLSPEVWK